MLNKMFLKLKKILTNLSFFYEVIGKMKHFMVTIYSAKLVCTKLRDHCGKTNTFILKPQKKKKTFSS